MSRFRRPLPSVWTSTDALLLEVESVERWASIAITDGDGSTSALVDITNRLRSTANRIADYLFRNSAPVRRNTRKRTRPATPDVARRGSAAKVAEKQGRGADSPKPPAGRAQAGASGASPLPGVHQSKPSPAGKRNGAPSHIAPQNANSSPPLDKEQGNG